MPYRPENLRVDKTPDGFRLVDATLNKRKDAELCRCSRAGGLDLPKKREFLDWIVHVVKEHCKTKTRGDCQRCGEEDLLEVLALDPELGLGDNLALCWECFSQALVSGVQSWHTRTPKNST